ncbi:hypothetical protein LEL_05678 [Akanthomyces lecanii RCEF 1005]|uniref:Uncharacterized protein n=1 Tax=Akanthomyces lecanii RCEF 1005 TaxID=1081108 RepID=A0A168G409_CORDF|nr:hypothetical protein LEL_05678 [Akanthomyces lecanii RCEF 1005]
MASNVELPSPIRLNLPPAPRDIDRRGYYDERLELIDEISHVYVGLRQGKILEREFGCFQQAIFVLLDPGFREGIKGDLVKIRSIGDAAKDFTNLFIASQMPPLPATYTTQATISDASTAASLPPTETKSWTRSLCSAARRAMHRITPNVSTYHSASGDPPATETATAVTLKRKSSTPSMTPPENTKSNRRNRRGLLETDYSKCITEEESRGEDRALRKVDRRDLHICVISGRKGSLENVSILPNSVNPDSAQLSILRMLLGEDFQVRIRGLLERLNWRDDDWNIFTLNGHLSSMYELGLIGFRPTKIVPCVDENGCRAIRVYFEFHFLGPTETNLSLDDFPASYASLGEMCTLQGDYKNNMSRYSEFDATTGERFTDGAEFCIRHSNRRYAENMFACLALSWTARMVLFLAGGAGNAVVDLDDFHRKEDAGDEHSLGGCGCCRICLRTH